MYEMIYNYVIFFPFFRAEKSGLTLNIYKRQLQIFSSHILRALNSGLMTFGQNCVIGCLFLTPCIIAKG